MNNYDEFFDDNPWGNISEPIYPNGHRFFLNDDRFWVSMDKDGYRVLFVHDVFTGELDIPDSLAGVNLELVPYENNYSRLVCRLTSCDSEFENKFSIVTKDIAYRSKGLKGNKLFNTIIEILRAWASFLKPQRQGLSSSEYIGLLGELYTVVEILSKEYSPSNTLSFWVGPEGKSQDFIVNKIAFEVKTSFSSTAKKITISSIDQLEKTTDKLFILHLIFNPSSNTNGFSLEELYKYFIKKIDNDLELKFNFYKKISDLYGKASDKQLKNKVILISNSIYEVTDSFPCLRKKDVPPSVEGVRYDLLIPSIKGYEIKESIGDVIKYG